MTDSLIFVIAVPVWFIFAHLIFQVIPLLQRIAKAIEDKETKPTP